MKSNLARTNPAFFRSKGGGQYFKRLGEEIKVISLYDFNPCVEKTRFTPSLLEALQCVPCSEHEFGEAQKRVVQLLELS
jgi:hypothetical protein